MATGNHVYEVIVVNPHGVPYGQIVDADALKCVWELDSPGTLDFTVPTVQASTPNSLRNLLPPRAFPAGGATGGIREVQVWRDGALIWWGVPVSAKANKNTVTVHCEGLLWYLQRMSFGPVNRDYLINGNFEQGTDSWTAVGTTMTSETSLVVTGSKSMRLAQTVGGADAFAYQQFAITAGAIGVFVDVSGWYIIDPGVAATDTAIADRGLYIQGTESGVVKAFAFAPLTNASPLGVPVRLEVNNPSNAFIVPAGHTWTCEVRCYSPAASLIWDEVHARVQESVGSTAVAGNDIRDIVANIMAYIQDPTRGRGNLNIGTAAGMTGVILVRHYQFYDNGRVLDALQEFPTIGAADYEIVFYADGTTRTMTMYAPGKGSVKMGMVAEVHNGSLDDFDMEADGRSTASASRVLGRGSGSNAELGYAVNAGNIGGRYVTDGSVTYKSTTVTSATANFTAADVGVAIYGADLPRGCYIVSVTSATAVVVSLGATGTSTAEGLGIGGIIFDDVLTAPVDFPMSTLVLQAVNNLAHVDVTQMIHTLHVQADGPTGWMGQVTTGDVIQVSMDYGWAQDLALRRIYKITLDAKTEMMELVTNHA